MYTCLMILANTVYVQHVISFFEQLHCADEGKDVAKTCKQFLKPYHDPTTHRHTHTKNHQRDNVTIITSLKEVNGPVVISVIFI